MLLGLAHATLHQNPTLSLSNWLMILIKRRFASVFTTRHTSVKGRQCTLSPNATRWSCCAGRKVCLPVHNTHNCSWTACRNLALARLTLQQLRCRASAGLPQWNFSDATIKNTNYGDMLRKNKTRVGQAANNASASWEEKALVIAMAMRETQHMMVCLPHPELAKRCLLTPTQFDHPSVAVK